MRKRGKKVNLTKKQTFRIVPPERIAADKMQAEAWIKENGVTKLDEKYAFGYRFDPNEKTSSLHGEGTTAKRSRRSGSE